MEPTADRIRDFLQAIDAGEFSVVAFVFGFLFLALFFTGIVIDVILIIHVLLRPPDWRECVRKIKSRPWTWREGAAILLLLTTAYSILMIYSSMGHYLHPSEEGIMQLTPILLHTMLLPAVSVTLVISLMNRRGLSWEKAFGIEGRNFLTHIRQGVIFYLASIPVVIICTLLYKGFLVSVGYPVDSQPLLRLMVEPGIPAWFYVYISIIAVLAAPLFEELVFRGVIIPVMSKHAGMSLVVFFVSFVFAVLHGHVPSIVPLFIIAVAFSVAYLYSGSILVPIVMHALFNGISLTALFLFKETPIFTP